MEMLIVVAIIAVLVAIAIPVYTSQMHKVRVAADLANVRAYYAQIQADYMLTEEYNTKVPNLHDDTHKLNDPIWKTITFLDGTKTPMQDGFYFVTYIPGKGYNVTYTCSKGTCTLTLG